MNALVRKEVRLLLPNLVLGLAAALALWLLPGPGRQVSALRELLVPLLFIISPAMLVMLTLGSFGRELSGGTFSLLLVQPVSRTRVWWTKTLLLAGAVALMGAVWWLTLIYHPGFQAAPREDRRDVFVLTLVFVIAAYSGGLWTVLLFRQVAVAFWATVLTPAVLAMATMACYHKRGESVDPDFQPALLVVFAIYGVAGFGLARWLFLRAQDAHWTGGTLALPEWSGRSGLFRWDASRRQPRPRRALWAKEFGLQQSQFIIAGVLALLHLAVLAARKFGGDFKHAPALQFTLEQFWGLWLVMPFLVGCAAVAEERRLGTLAGQLSLPSGRRGQLVIKCASVLLLSVVFGAVIPWLFEGSRVLPDFGPESIWYKDSNVLVTPGGTSLPLGEYLAILRGSVRFLWLAGMAVMLALPAFYASTITRSTLQALAPGAVGIVILGVLGFSASSLVPTLTRPLWSGALIYVLGVPVMALVLGRLMVWNFNRVSIDGVVWWRNAWVLLLAVAAVTTLTTAVYHRVWESFMTLEPPHASPRLPVGSRVSLRAEGWNLSVQLPDGRNWSGRFNLGAPGWVAMISGDWRVQEGPGSAGFLEGTNWITVARTYRDVVAVAQDGSLWASQQPVPWRQAFFAAATSGTEKPSLIRVGADSDWKAIAGSSSPILLLKTNGTLWRWGTNRVDWRHWPGVRAFVPERLGSASDWSEVLVVQHGKIALLNTAGETWVLETRARAQPNAGSIHLEGDLYLTREASLDGQRSAISTWTAGRLGLMQVGVSTQGILQISGTWAGRTRFGMQSENIQLGLASNWVTVAGTDNSVISLDAAGSLWKWRFPADPIAAPESAHAIRLSRHSDWVAVTEEFGGIVGLAADGSLWFWAMPGRTLYPSSSAMEPLLEVSRRPQRIGNIFASSAP